MTASRTLLLPALALFLILPDAVSVRAGEAPKLAGSWTWEWKDGQGAVHRHVLEVEGDGATLAARERFDDLEPVKVEGLKVAGSKVNFAVRRGDRLATYSGTLANADTINGKVVVAVENQSNELTWTAKRKPLKSE